MALSGLHTAVVTAVLALPEAQDYALAGGGAMLAHGLVERPTHDVDLFTTARDVHVLADAVQVALRSRGYTVSEEPGRSAQPSVSFARLTVIDPGGEAVLVEFARDTRIRAAVRLQVGAVLHPEELAADKMLALFGRAEARDLVDVDALTSRYSHKQLLALAEEKDPGFSGLYFAQALQAAAAHPDHRYTALGLSPPRLADLRDHAQRWQQELRSGSAPPPTDGARLNLPRPAH